jgi:hypothetical protein
MRMMRHRRTPGMEHGDKAGLGPQVLGIGRDLKHGLSRGLEQHRVDRGLVLVSDVRDGRGQREHLVEVLNRQQLSLAGSKPFARRRTLALRAVPVHATINLNPAVGGGRGC